PMPDDPRPGTWRVEVVAPRYGDRVVRAFRVPRRPVAETTPEAAAPAEEPAPPAPETAAAPAEAGGNGAGPWPWIAGGIAAIAALGLLAWRLAARRRG